MKVRTCVIFACMTIVPALAMFSHRLPSGIREAMRTRLWEPVEEWVASLTAQETKKTPIGASDNAADESIADIPSGPDRASLPASQVFTAIDVEPPSPAAEALLALGATAIDCRPFEGTAGTHVASCRMAVDTAGQLHRVFQAAGRNSDEAFESLLETVRAWKARMARGSVPPRL